MALYNKAGTEFAHMVAVDRPQGHAPTYTHSFPVAVGTRVEERWSTKARPIKSMTRYLQGCALKRYVDYMVDFNAKTNKFEYWFAQGKHATLFQLAVSNLQQEYASAKPKLTAVCPCCQHRMNSWEIEWEV